MARKRMIDPVIWTDPKVLQLESKAVLVYIGIITHADDEGIIELEPTSIYFKLARTDINTEELIHILDRLEEVGLIKRYGAYGFLPTWYKHQNLKSRKPQPTKDVRPPKEILLQYPQYIAEWEKTFSTKDVPVPYPFDTCFVVKENQCATSEAPVSPPENSSETTKNTGETPVCNQCATGSTPVEHNRSEVKGSEKKGIEDITGESGDPPESGGGKIPRDALIPPQHLSAEEVEVNRLYHAIQDAFLSQNGMKFTNWGKEGTAIKQIIKKAKARSPADITTFTQSMITRFWELKTTSRDKFWSSQPFLPSALNSSGIWDRVLETFREDPGVQEMTQEEFDRLAKEGAF